MRKLLIFLLLCFVADHLPAQIAELYHRARVDMHRRTAVELARLGIEVEHGVLLPGRHFTGDLSDSELERLRNEGFSVETLISDVSAWYAAREEEEEESAVLRGSACNTGPASVKPYKTPAHYSKGSMGGFPTYAQMLAQLDEMAALFPQLITLRKTVNDTLKTAEGRPLWWVKISDKPDSNETEPKVLYTALHHAREPLGLSQLLFYMWYLLENYEQNPEIQYIVNNTELFFIPCLNPDGYVYNETTNPNGGGLWRKNRRPNGGGAYGVDLNRNYGYQWGLDDDGSSAIATMGTYRGPAAFSEAETRLVRQFCLQHPFNLALNYHSFGNLLLYPWAYNDTPADPAFEGLSKVLVQENAFHTGTVSQTVGYPVNGSSDDWMFGGADVLAFTAEVGPADPLGNSIVGFWPPQSKIDALNKADLWQNLAAALSLLHFGTLQDRSDEAISLQQPQLKFRLKRYGFEDGPFYVSLASLNDKAVVSSTLGPFFLQQFETVDSLFALNPGPGLTTGDTAVLLLTLDNGVYVRTDTLRKLLLTPAQTLLNEDGALTADWSLGEWGSTGSAFYSAPTSITDSPEASYASDASNVLEQVTPVLIPASARTARLRFQARWRIEQAYDFAQVLVSVDGAAPVPLCGRYTQAGIEKQPQGEPVYDGYQPAWVEECMDLSPHIGQSVQVQFRMVSDGQIEYDGFYFDDLKIEYTEKDVVGATLLGDSDFRLRQNQPNPVAEKTVVRWAHTGALNEEANLLIFNALGVLKNQIRLDLRQQNQIEIDTDAWPAGVYTYCIQSVWGQTPALKMMVMPH